jgi:hypothetical protein
VEAVLEHDHCRAAGGCARDLDRVLDRLGPRVDEDRLALARAGRVLCETTAQLDIRLVRADHEALVEEGVDLLVDRGDDGAEAVARVLAGDPAGEVEVDRAVDCLDLRSLGATDDEPRRRDSAGDVPPPGFEQVVGGGALAQ